MLDPRKLAAMPRADLEAAYVQLDAQSRQAAPAPIKDGFKTTEFWATLIGHMTVLVAVVLAFSHGEIETERMLIIMITAGGGASVLATWYTSKRTELKQTDATAKADAAAAANKAPAP